MSASQSRRPSSVAVTRPWPLEPAAHRQAVTLFTIQPSHKTPCKFPDFGDRMAEIDDTEDQWSDAHEALEDDNYESHPRGIEEVEVHNEDDMPDRGVKISTHDKDDSSAVLESSRGPSLSATADHISDSASVHSLPVVRITEADRTPQRSSTSRNIESSLASHAPPSPSRSVGDGALTPQDRRHRHRSAIEVRSSNRLSGFFTNLIHRRDNLPNSTTRNASRDVRSSSPAPVPPSNNPSRSSSPLPARSSTPPPQLPPPTLQELGLSLSALTSDLSPSHFSTPPSSGAFLAPHYLLLCHAQGLDVLPLVSPPAPQPYALVRRVTFKSVVVMEQRGVLVAIAGRRDGVRVYALEEVKKAVEWRVEVEVRRERERMRREAMKKITAGSLDGITTGNEFAEKVRKAALSTDDPVIRDNLSLDTSHKTNHPPPLPPVPLVPRTPTIKKPKTRINPPPTPEPAGRPPPYSGLSDAQPPLQRQSSVVSFNQTRSRSSSVTNVLGAAPLRRNTDASRPRDPDSKADWVESSDDEAINIVAAGSSGSQALDERTSALSANLNPPPVPTQSNPSVPRTPTSLSMRRNRPTNLDLSLSRTNSAVAPSEPSPAPTLLTLRQALSHSPPSVRDVNTPQQMQDLDTPIGVDEDDDEVDGRISLVQALLESRIPDLPPVGTRRPQQPILLSHPIATGDEEQPSPRTSETNTHEDHVTPSAHRPERRRRRWSVILGQGPIPSTTSTPANAPATRERGSSRSQTFRSNQLTTSTVQPPPSGELVTPSSAEVPPLPETSSTVTPSQSSRSRFIPRIISNAFQHRRSDNNSPVPVHITTEIDGWKKGNVNHPATHTPPPKLEYVKLPGTKGALMIKSVETAKKSFLAILCGENGEKVELFAGTYRTALGLSRTFILPDSPRSLELQLQGDDLVEVFLVFSQNVFGLEPATVRVREVRIGRAERRAARRRAREIRTGEAALHDQDAPEEDMNVNVSIGVTVAVGSTITASGEGPDGPLVPNQHPDEHPDQPATPNEPMNAAIAHAEKLVALATAQMGPYTTFQQLSFAPKFPLASIADEYIIPPTYPDFLDYRTEHEPETTGTTGIDLAQIQFSPPGLPVPAPSAPCKWYYRDPKNVTHGPWKASLMQAWYKDGLLPPDLPVRREEDTEYMLLKDLRLQSVDPSHPFRSPPPPPPPNPHPATVIQDSTKPLLQPISLLSQPRHFGPPALFFSSRGGHSTAIVDARGRSVLKGRFVWSEDDHDEDMKPALMTRMGDIKRLEAFDVKDRAVLVAMRQGGLEVVDLGDALLKPADESRAVLPQFSPPPSNTSRRGPFVWKIGTPVSSSPTSSTILSNKIKGGHSHIPGKKQSTGSAKSPAGRTEFSPGDADSDIHDEVLFLGRKDDEIYICERNAGFFRILRLCPMHHDM